MEKLLNYDYAAALVFTILIISIIMRHMFHGRVNRVFLETIMIMFFSTVLDIVAVYLDNTANHNMFLREISHQGYLIMHVASIPFYVTYLIYLSDTLHIVTRDKIKFVLTMAPLAITEIIILINPLTHKVFYIENYEYVRGPWMAIPYACAAFYFIYGMLYIINNARYFEKSQRAPLFMVFPFSVTGVLLQFFLPDTVLEMLTLAICMLFVLLMVHKPDEKIHAGTQLKNMPAYDFDIKRILGSCKPVHNIMINICNYLDLIGVVSQEKLQDAMRSIAGKLQYENSKHHLDASIYYIEQGRFRVIVESNKDEKAHKLAADMREFLTNEIEHFIPEATLNTIVCIADCPTDIDTFDEFYNFGYYLNKLEKSDEVVEAASLLQDKKYDLTRNMDSILQNAIANRYFEVYYQPIYSVTEGRFNSAEALLRLNDKVHAFIPPDVFIPAAEENGLINKIGDIVFDSVCSFISSDEYKTLGLDYIEVNLSVKQCIQPDLATSLLGTMEKYGVRPDQINLEITETAASAVQKTMMHNIQTLTDAGISFSLDDYGTGYSNIKRISTLPLDIIKLDKTFTDLTNDKLNIVIKNTVNMIKDMNMKIVVEGVETKEMLEHFSNLNCDYIQGYYFSRPLPKSQFIEFIENQMESA